MPKLRIGDAVARLPIVQGGMGVGISLSGLASAVANEGGIGVIAANSIGMLDPEYYAKNKDANSIILRREIRKAQEKGNPQGPRKDRGPHRRQYYGGSG
jgi:NAD(P)H-dependent flavin oxidoreductase YrpB (nitropropane dioxygenase family)